MFDVIKIDGILNLKTNLEEIGKDNTNFETDLRKNTLTESVICKYLYKSSLAKHRETCIVEGPKAYGIEMPFLKRSDLKLTDGLLR